MGEVGTQRSCKGERSPSYARELLRAKTGGREITQEKPLAEVDCPPLTLHINYNTRMSGASPSR